VQFGSGREGLPWTQMISHAKTVSRPACGSQGTTPDLYLRHLLGDPDAPVADPGTS
jgi:hypothetical protein